MNKNTPHRFRKVAIAGVSALAAAGILGGSLVFAQSPSGGSSSATDHAAKEAAYTGKVASNLGVTVDALNQAIKKADVDTINEMEQAGQITAAQAANARQRIEDEAAQGHYQWGAGGPGMGREGHGGPGGPGGPGGEMRGGTGIAGADVAGFLGITEAQLRAEMQASGATLASVAQAHGKSRDQLKAFLTDAFKTHLAEEVTSGEHTQAEADQQLAQFTANLDAMIDGTGGMKGGPGMGRGFEHGPKGAPNSANGSSSGSGTN